MTIFEIYLGPQFQATQELEYHEIDGLQLHIGQGIQQHKTYANPQKKLVYHQRILKIIMDSRYDLMFSGIDP